MTAKTAIEKIKKAFSYWEIEQSQNFNYTTSEIYYIKRGILDGFEIVAKINADEIEKYYKLTQNWLRGE